MRARRLVPMLLAGSLLATLLVTNRTAAADRQPAVWSATTLEAASAPEHKKALTAGKPATITGEVIDVSCYMQLKKRGEAHVACGTKCIQHGEPIGVVDGAGKVYVLYAEQHHPRRDGQTDVRAMFLPHLGTMMSIPGTLVERGGERALFVTVPADTTTMR